MDEDRPHVGFQIDRRPVIGEGNHSGRGGGADAGKDHELFGGFREDAGTLGAHLLAGPLQIQGSAVVSHPLPLGQHLGSISRRQRVNGGEYRHEPGPTLHDAGHLGLLQHHFADQHTVGVTDVAPGHFAVVLFTQGKDPGAELIP